MLVPDTPCRTTMMGEESPTLPLPLPLPLPLLLLELLLLLLLPGKGTFDEAEEAGEACPSLAQSRNKGLPSNPSRTARVQCTAWWSRR